MSPNNKHLKRKIKNLKKLPRNSIKVNKILQFKTYFWFNQSTLQNLQTINLIQN